MEENKKNNAVEDMNDQNESNNSNKTKTNQDFTGYPHYPANKDMLKQENTEELSADDKSLNAPHSGENVPTYPKKEDLRGEMDKKSGDLPGKKDQENEQ